MLLRRRWAKRLAARATVTTTTVNTPANLAV
jgi:hypothetical protein